MDHRKNLINHLSNDPLELGKFIKEIYEDKQNKGPVYSILLVDASASMATRKTDTIKGCRDFLAGQCKSLEGRDVTLFINYFNTDRRNVYKGPLFNIDNQPLYFDALEQYKTQGMTKLFGSIVELVADVQREISGMIEHSSNAANQRFVEEPTVVFTILTDGQDNSSGNVTAEDVKNIIEESGWEFIYLRDKGVRLSAQDIGIKYDIKYDMDNTTEACRAFDTTGAVLRYCT